MKIDRFGQARVLSSDELDQIIDEIPAGPHRVLANLLRRTSARVSEGLALQWKHIGQDSILFPAPVTKGGKKSRHVPLHPILAKELAEWRKQFKTPINKDDWVFPGQNPYEHLSRQSFDYVLRKSAKQIGLEGVSTHSFRRSFLTSASHNGIALREIQSISGHSDLGTLQRYLEVSESAKKNVVMASA